MVNFSRTDLHGISFRQLHWLQRKVSINWLLHFKIFSFHLYNCTIVAILNSIMLPSSWSKKWVILHQVSSESESSTITCSYSYILMQINKTVHEFKILKNSYIKKTYWICISIRYLSDQVSTGSDYLNYTWLFQLFSTYASLIKQLSSICLKEAISNLIWRYRRRYSHTKSMSLFICIFQFQFAKLRCICNENRISYKCFFQLCCLVFKICFHLQNYHQICLHQNRNYIN